MAWRHYKDSLRRFNLGLSLGKVHTNYCDNNRMYIIYFFLFPAESRINTELSAHSNAYWAKSEMHRWSHTAPDKRTETHSLFIFHFQHEEKVTQAIHEGERLMKVELIHKCWWLSLLTDLNRQMLHDHLKIKLYSLSLVLLEVPSC